MITTTLMNDDPSQLSDDQSRAVAAVIREEIARRRISRQRLADQAKISISTLEKALAGRRPFTLTTTIRLEEALGVSLRMRQQDIPIAPPRHNGVARGDLGSYARASVSWIEGRYLTVRPSFGDKDAIYAYQTEIAWDEQRSSLIFRESQRLDAEFTHHGDVSMPNQSGHIYLLVNSNGQYRMIILARPTPARTGRMHGILTTLLACRGAQLTPVAAPIALIPMSAVNPLEFGRIAAGHPCYETYRKALRRTLEEPFALFLPV
jgi:transcriptional regulator with XRE-family HTH domain